MWRVDSFLFCISLECYGLIVGWIGLVLNTLIITVLAILGIVTMGKIIDWKIPKHFKYFNYRQIHFLGRVGVFLILPIMAPFLLFAFINRHFIDGINTVSDWELNASKDLILCFYEAWLQENENLPRLVQHWHFCYNTTIRVPRHWLAFEHKSGIVNSKWIHQWSLYRSIHGTWKEHNCVRTHLYFCWHLPSDLHQFAVH